MNLTKERLDILEAEHALEEFPKIKIGHVDGEPDEVNTDQAAEWVATHHSVLKKGLKTLIDAKTAATWQPIETAPRDGTQIIGWDEKKGFSYVCFWDDYSPLSQAGILFLLGEGRKGDFYSTWEYEYRNTMIPVKPTHWMPLPTPPEKSE